MDARAGGRCELAAGQGPELGGRRPAGPPGARGRGERKNSYLPVDAMGFGERERGGRERRARSGERGKSFDGIKALAWSRDPRERDKVFFRSLSSQPHPLFSFFLFPPRGEIGRSWRERVRERAKRAPRLCRFCARARERIKRAAGKRQGFFSTSSHQTNKKPQKLTRSASCSSPPSPGSTSSSWVRPGRPSPSCPAGWPSWSGAPTLRGC